MFNFKSKAGARLKRSGLVVASVVAFGSFASATTSQPFGPMIGTWSGNGQVRLDDGKMEAVKCKAFYTEKSPGIGLALRCASSASKIDLRATLKSASGKLSGQWEERQFNAAGSLVGTSTGNSIKLAIEGGGLKATIAVTTSGANQTMAIVSETGGFKGVNIALARD